MPRGVSFLPVRLKNHTGLWTVPCLVAMPLAGFCLPHGLHILGREGSREVVIKQKVTASERGGAKRLCHELSL